MAERGLTNYWGYNSIGFFAPDVRYASKGLGNQVYEFKSMVKTMHSAGIEVILDVVYNHTGEGNHLGPTLSLRGIDNRTYYRLDQNQRFYTDFTGTGNSLNMQHPRTIQLIMDSLRYWVNDMHVDGFRFDLAPVLARELHDVDKLSAFFDIIHQDPTLSRVKLIAEPWDVGPGGYQVGNFPIRWAEWNGRYRDAVRHYWHGDSGWVPELASRLAGSSDIYESSGRGAYASINFVTAHDGYTLYDLVSYEQKHNEDERRRAIATATTTTSAGTGVPRAKPPTRRFSTSASASCATSSPRSHFRRACRCCRTATRSLGRSTATTTRTHRTTRRVGSIGISTTANASSSRSRDECLNIRHSHAVLRRRHFFRGEPTVKDGPKDRFVDPARWSRDDWVRLE